MAYSTQRAVSDGTLAYLDLSIEYMKRADIAVFYDGLPAAPGSWAWVGTTDKRITFSPVVPNGVEVLIKRTTQINTIINKFANGAKFNNATMDQDFTQLLYLNQEAVEGAALTDIFNDVDFHGYKIKNLGLAVDDTDAITFGQVKSISTGAYQAKLDAEAARDLAQKWATQLTTPVSGSDYSAKQYALNAAGSASASAGSASAAAGSASAASGSASAASGSAGAAAGSASAAATAKTAAETARDVTLGYRNDAQAAAADVDQIQQNAQDAIDIATTFDGRLTTAESNASAAVTASGNAVSTSNLALAAAANASVGQCRFVFVSTTQCQLQRHNGMYVIINGTPQAIPAAGVNLTNTGLAATTRYYVYVYMNGSTMTLEAVATAPATDTNTGIRIKTGDATRTLVGMVVTSGTSTFLGTGTDFGVASWFNKRPYTVVQSPYGSSFTNTSEAVVGLGSSILAWAGDNILTKTQGRLQSNTLGAIVVQRQTWNEVSSGTNSVFYAAQANAQGDVVSLAEGAMSADGQLRVRYTIWTSAGTGSVVTSTQYTTANI